jgi:predicted Zn-dependent protease
MGLWDRLSRRLDELSEELLPDDLRDTVEGARELLARGEPGAAIAALDRVLAAKPDHATALYLLGLAQLRRNDMTAARGAFEQAIAVRAGFTEAMVGLAEARLGGGRRDPDLARRPRRRWRPRAPRRRLSRPRTSLFGRR